MLSRARAAATCEAVRDGRHHHRGIPARQLRQWLLLGAVVVVAGGAAAALAAPARRIVLIAGGTREGFGGDGGPATTAELYKLAGVAADQHGDVFSSQAGMT